MRCGLLFFSSFFVTFFIARYAEPPARIQEGGITFFILDGWKVLTQFKHVVGIKQLFSDPAGTRVFFVDDKEECFVYNPVNDAVYPVPGVTVAGAVNVLWDVRPGDQGTMALVLKDSIVTLAVDANHYLGATSGIMDEPQDSLSSHTSCFPWHAGPRILNLGSTPRDSLLSPLVLLNGTLHCLAASGKVSLPCLE